MSIFRKCPRGLPHANTKRLRRAIAQLYALVPEEFQSHPENEKGNAMSSPTGMVQIAQADLDTFATEVQSAIAVISGYIQQLLANQSTPLPAADESALTAAVTALEGLEPPAPAPSP